MPTPFAKLLDAIPIVPTTAYRNAFYPSTTVINQRVHNLETGNIEKWNGTSWDIDFEGSSSGGNPPVQHSTGSPEGVVSAGLGGIYQQTDGANGAVLWKKNLALSATTGWALLPTTAGVVNVLDYGAKGDGTTDDTAAIQGALTAAITGGVVVFPPAIYRADGLTLTDATQVTVDARGATIRARTNATGTIILALLNCARCQVLGGTWDGNTLARCGIQVATTSTGVQLHGVAVRNITQLTGETVSANAIELKPVGAATAPIYTEILDVNIDGVDAPITGVARGIYVGSDGGPTGVVPLYTQIRGGSIRNITPNTNGDGIQFSDAAITTKIWALVDGVTFVETAKRAVKVGCEEVLVRNCLISNTVASWPNGPISLYSSHTSAIGNRILGPRTQAGIEIGASGTIDDILVSGNSIELDASTSVSGQDGIRVMTDCTHVLIQNNLVRKCRSGIVLNTGNTTGADISGNVLIDFTTDGIRLDVTSPILATGCVIAGNVFDTATGPVGILLKDGLLNVLANNTAVQLGGSALLIFGLTSDNVAQRWGNLGGTVQPKNNVFLAPNQFTTGVGLPQSADRGDAGVTLTWGTDSPTQVFNTTLTAPRTVALAVSPIGNGAEFTVVRTAAASGVSALNVGTGPLIALQAGQWCRVSYNGSAWVVIASGFLLTTTTGGGATATSASPAGTTSTTAVMMAAGGTLTPIRTGVALLTISGQMANATLNDGATVQLRYGTGTAPSNGAAVTGTLAGISQTATSLVAAAKSGFNITARVSGLTLGTAYWVDIALNAVTGGTATVTGVTVTTQEV